MRSLLVLAGLIATTAGFQFAFPRESLNQNATLLCTKEGNNCTMEVRITSADSPDLLLFESADLMTNTIGVQTNTVGTLIAGLGTEAVPWIVTVDVPCDAVSATGSAADALGEYDGETLTTRIVVKDKYNPALQGINLPLDVRYTAVCNFSLAGPNIVTSGMLLVSGTNFEDGGPPEVDSAVLTTRLQSDPTTDVTAVVQGQDIFFRAAINDAANSQARGLKLYGCKICDSTDCTGVSFPFIADSGCSLNPTFYSGFTDVTDATKTTGVTATTAFQAFRLSTNSPVFYLRCKVNFCYTPDDPSCRDPCAASTLRKKRQADEPEGDNTRNVVTRITILLPGEASVQIGNYNTTTPNNEQEPKPAIKEANSEENSALLAAVIALSAMVVIVIVVTICSYFYLANKNRRAIEKI